MEKISRVWESDSRWEIDFLANAVADAASQLSRSHVDRELLEARLADYCRDSSILPLPQAAFAAAVAGLDDASWRRFGVIISIFDFHQIRAPWALAAKYTPLQLQIENGMVGTAKTLAALDLPIIAKSMVRAEEFARRLALGLSIGFVGETPEQSAQRLAKIDYQRLLDRVDAAKSSAEDQMNALMQHQEDDDQRVFRRRRGKW